MKSTKIISTILTMCILLGCCCGCGAEAGHKDVPNTSPEPEVSATVEATMSIPAQITDAPEPEPTPAAIPLVDKWEVNTVTNEIPITPEGYEGDKVTLVKKYTGERFS